MCNSQTHTHAGTHKKRMGSHARIRTHDNEENKTNRHIHPTNKIKCVKVEIKTNTHLQRNKHRQNKQTYNLNAKFHENQFKQTHICKEIKHKNERTN